MSNKIKCLNCKNYKKQIPSDLSGACHKKWDGPGFWKLVFDNSYCYDDFDPFTKEQQWAIDYIRALQELHDV